MSFQWINFPILTVKINSRTIILREDLITIGGKDLLFVRSKVTVNVPNHADKVTYCQDDNNQLESFEEIGDHQNEHDVIVVQITVIRKLWFILNDSLQIFAKEHFDLAHKSI